MSLISIKSFFLLIGFREGQVVRHKAGDRKEVRKENFDAFFEHRTALCYQPPNSYGADLFRWIIIKEGDGKPTYLLMVFAFKTSQSGSVSNTRIQQNQEQARRWLKQKFPQHEMDILNKVKKDLSNGKLRIVFVYVVLSPPIPFTKTEVQETLEFEYKDTKGEVQSCEISVTTTISKNLVTLPTPMMLSALSSTEAFLQKLRPKPSPTSSRIPFSAKNDLQ